MPRTFTRAELTQTITTGQYSAMSSADKLAFDHALTALWEQNYTDQCARDNTADYDAVDSHRRFELGE